MERLGGGEDEGEHGYVVFLAESGGGVGDLLRRLPADLPRPVKAEKFTLRVAGFENAVGEKGERVAGGEGQRGFPPGGIGGEAEGQAEIAFVLVTITIRGEMAGIGNRYGSIWLDAGDEAGDEAAAQAAD